MCGIGGVVFTKSTKAQMEMADAMFTELEDRGRHASGVSFVWEDADNWVTRRALSLPLNSTTFQQWDIITLRP